MFEIGSSLREARTRQGLELSDAEAATKVRARYLEALEDERFDLLPAQTYVKGFLRSYAEYLGLDGQLYVDEFNSRFADGEDDLPTSMRPPRPRSGRQVESAVVLVALAGIVAVTALVVVAFTWGGSADERAPRFQAPAPASQNEPSARRRGRAPWFSLHVVAARGATALTVRRPSRTGRVLFDGTLEHGNAMTFTGARLWLRAARPQNLDLRLDGRPARIAARTLVATARGVRPAG